MIPEALTKGLAVHAAMLQVSGNGEASKAKLKAATDALKTGTKWGEAPLRFCFSAKQDLRNMGEGRFSSNDAQRVE